MLEELSIKDLQQKCLSLGLEKYSKLNKDELIKLIETREVEEVVKFQKIISNPYTFNGRTIKDDFFELSKEEANHPRIKTAIENKLIKIK